jgi:hypothetical protein
VATSAFASNLSAATFLDDQEAVQEIEADGVEIIDWDAEERRKLRAIAAEAMEGYAQGSEMAQRAYEAHIAFMQKINLL